MFINKINYWIIIVGSAVIVGFLVSNSWTIAERNPFFAIFVSIAAPVTIGLAFYLMSRFPTSDKFIAFTGLAILLVLMIYAL